MKNWKTTLAGVFGAAVQVVVPLVQTGQVGWQALLVAAGMAAMGYFAKDFNISGTEQ